MFQQYIAVCGLSAVGKQTLIDELGRDPALRERFGIAGQMSIYGPSARNLQKLRRDDGQSAVWKWQFDTHYTIYGLRIDYESSIHRVILIWRNPEGHWPHYAKRAEAKGHDLASLSRKWPDEIVPLFGPDSVIQRRLKIVPEVVDGSRPGYPEIGW